MPAAGNVWFQTNVQWSGVIVEKIRLQSSFLSRNRSRDSQQQTKQKQFMSHVMSDVCYIKIIKIHLSCCKWRLSHINIMSYKDKFAVFRMLAMFEFGKGQSSVHER